MSQVSACDFFLIKYRGPLLIPFGIPTQVFFSDTRHQKQSLASLYEYFGNAVAGKKPKLGNKMELLEVPFSKTYKIKTFIIVKFILATHIENISV
jgi:hypothetical protein